MFPGSHAGHTYARIECERRFLLARFPVGASATRVRRITDRYIENTTLRLRQIDEGGRASVFKLTQKLPESRDGIRRGLITSMHLTEAEFGLLTGLPAKTLIKARHSLPPFGVDVFEGHLQGLIMAEAEFDSVAEASSLEIPAYIAHEVTGDERFTGGRLVAASAEDVRSWLAEYGIG